VRDRRPVALVVALLVAGVGAVPETVAAHGPPSQGIYVTTAVVDVKKGPGPQYETIRTLPKGKVFEIVGKQERWLMVRLSEHESTPGFVDDRFAVVKKPHDDPQRRFPIPGTYLTMTPMDVRVGPGEQHAVVATIPKGTRVVVVGLEAHWLRIASRHGDPPRYVDRSQARLQPAD
jgi:N-acetylmuramoyl-L-alanine amidase